MTTTPWSTIPELVDDAGRRFPEVEAMVDGDIRWTFPELAAEVHRAARALMAAGVNPGDRVAIWAPNIWEWAVTALGIHCAGAVLVPINTRWKGKEAAYVLEKADVNLLFTVTDFLDTDYVALLADTGAELDEVVVMRGTVPEGATPFADFMGRGDNIDDSERAARSQSVQATDLCHIMFTSGTTGMPKGAMLGHQAVCRAYLSWSTVVGLTEGDRYLILNPFFHSFGMNAGILACLMKGATMVPHPVFDVPSVMARIPEEQISMLPGPPAVYQTILNHPDLDQFDMSTLRLSVTGAAPVPVEMIDQMRQRLSFETIVTGYGLTECSGIATMCRHDDDPETISNTSGRAIDDVEVRVVDPEGTEVARGEPGEIVIRGYNIMQGYLDDADKTAETVDADGWLHTGDIGVMDDHGYIDITDRVKDMFINGGFNAYPAEIEAMMLSHPDVGQVAVVGVPDQRLGEVGYAFVVGAPDASTSGDEIITWCKTEMANYKVPRYVEFVDELPLNASNKVLKFELRKRAATAMGLN
ncbi:MAG: FadD3 family acyl-CoA ligase [Acidimicrobiales bacterium]